MFKSDLIARRPARTMTGRVALWFSAGIAPARERIATAMPSKDLKAVNPRRGTNGGISADGVRRGIIYVRRGIICVPVAEFLANLD
jgi:hypothetical protein